MLREIASAVVFLGAVQGLFLAFVLLRISRPKSSKNPFLIVLIIMSSLHMMYQVILETRLIYKVPHLVAVFDWFNLLYGPLLFFYVKRALDFKFKLRLIHLIHFVPVVIYLNRIYGLYLQDVAYKLAFIDSFFMDIEITNAWSTNMLIRAILGLYFIWSVYVYQKQKPDIKPLKGTKDRHRKFVAYVLIGFAVFYFSSLLRTIFFYELRLALLDSFLMTCLVYVLGYISLVESKSLKNLISSVEESQGTSPDWGVLSDKLSKCMLEEKPYLSSDISLSELAFKLEINPKRLSAFLNQELSTTFFNYINEWRVKEAQSILEHTNLDRFSLNKVYLDVGFRSKSSFYTAFKKFADQTPTEYRKRN